MQLGNGTIRIENDNGVARVTLSGEFDLANVDDVAAATADALWPAANLLVDLRHVTYCDTQLVEWLADTQGEVHARNGAMLVRANEHVLRLLTALGLTHSFDLVNGHSH